MMEDAFKASIHATASPIFLFHMTRAEIVSLSTHTFLITTTESKEAAADGKGLQARQAIELALSMCQPI